MKYTIYTLLLSMILFMTFSCSTSKNYVKDPNLSYFGETVQPKKYVGMDKMYATLAKDGVFNGKVKATVGSVCQKKGCWMTLTSPGSSDGLFVKFKDYGFFMPFDLAGSEVVVRGTAKKEVTSVDELRHYAMDGGATKEEAAKITEPETSYNFMADGVVVLK